MFLITNGTNKTKDTNNYFFICLLGLLIANSTSGVAPRKSYISHNRQKIRPVRAIRDTLFV